MKTLGGSMSLDGNNQKLDEISLKKKRKELVKTLLNEISRREKGLKEAKELLEDTRRAFK